MVFVQNLGSIKKPKKPKDLNKIVKYVYQPFCSTLVISVRNIPCRLFRLSTECNLLQVGQSDDSDVSLKRTLQLFRSEEEARNSLESRFLFRFPISCQVCIGKKHKRNFFPAKTKKKLKKLNSAKPSFPCSDYSATPFQLAIVSKNNSGRQGFFSLAKKKFPYLLQLTDDEL